MKRKNYKKKEKFIQKTPHALIFFKRCGGSSSKQSASAGAVSGSRRRSRPHAGTVSRCRGGSRPHAGTESGSRGRPVHRGRCGPGRVVPEHRRRRQGPGRNGTGRRGRHGTAFEVRNPPGRNGTGAFSAPDPGTLVPEPAVPARHIGSLPPVVTVIRNDHHRRFDGRRRRRKGPGRGRRPHMDCTGSETKGKKKHEAADCLFHRKNSPLLFCEGKIIFPESMFRSC